MRRRRPWGLRTAKQSPLSGVPKRPHGVALYTDQNEASPSLGAANCETDATFGDSWEEWWHSQARIRPHQPWGAAKCESVATFVGFWGAQRNSVICRPELSFAVPAGCELRNCRNVRGLLGGPAGWCHMQTRKKPPRPWGAANLETVAGFGGSWEAQQSGATRRSE